MNLFIITIYSSGHYTITVNEIMADASHLGMWAFILAKAMHSKLSTPLYFEA